jgi:hypothetical protein
MAQRDTALNLDNVDTSFSCLHLFRLSKVRDNAGHCHNHIFIFLYSSEVRCRSSFHRRFSSPSSVTVNVVNDCNVGSYCAIGKRSI